MDEFISKHEAYKMLKDKQAAYMQVAVNEAFGTAARMIDQMKPADVQPVRHGRWIEKPPYKDETVKGLEFQIVCSECDEQNCSLEFDENYNAIGKTFYRTRYCPNCGARMSEDGDTNETD